MTKDLRYLLHKGKYLENLLIAFIFSFIHMEKYFHHQICELVQEAVLNFLSIANCKLVAPG